MSLVTSVSFLKFFVFGLIVQAQVRKKVIVSPIKHVSGFGLESFLDAFELWVKAVLVHLGKTRLLGGFFGMSGRHGLDPSCVH